MSAKPAAYTAALYMRLSKDDDAAGESSSITSQRNMLTAYAREHGYRVVSEFVDDGYSGTSFDRPAFKRMLLEIENGKFNLILTKDLSRLGRDYIQTGQYTEVYFPSKKIRYIAINDGFDSEGQYTDIAPFKHVVNEMYARDTSKKIRSAFAAKMHNGCYIGSFAPYGYRKDPNDKNHLIPDEASAEVVRRIYCLAAEGIKPAGIADYLNEHGILSPALYRCSIHPQLDAGRYTKHKEWTPGSVGKLLRNMVYLGHMAQAKTTKVSFKSKMTLRNARENWIVVENTHEPIISQALYSTVQKRMESRTCEKKGEFCNIFSGIAKCADCGRNMSTVGTRRKGSPANLACGGYKLHGNSACSNHFIDYAVLYDIVLESVQEQVRLASDERDHLLQELFHQLNAKRNDEGEKNKIQKLRLESGKLDRIIEQLYDDKLNGRIAQDRFYKLLEKYEKQSEDLHCRICKLDGAEDKEQKDGAAKGAFEQLRKMMDKYGVIHQLTPDLLFDLIDRIEVGQGWYEKMEHGKVKHQEIKIYFRFMSHAQKKEFVR